MSITQSGTAITFNDATTQGTGVPTPNAVGQIPIANSSTIAPLFSFRIGILIVWY